MNRERREPEAIRRKRQRRSSEEIDEIRRRKRIERDKRARNDRRRYQDNDLDDEDRKSDISIAKKAAILTVAVVVLIIVGLGLYLMSFLNKIQSDSTLIGVAPGKNEPLNVLILGMDIGDPNQVENTGIKRTDTMMLFNYNPTSKSAKIVSIPRDTLVSNKGVNYKINSAYQRGGEAKVKQIVENMLSVNINYIVKIDYEAFRGFIDAIGGVRVDIERDMIYDDPYQNLHINLKKGKDQLLDGDKAEQFFRWRKNNDGSGFANGDLDRIENQHKFLAKVVEKCTSPTIIFKVPKILDVIASNVGTNMPANKILYYGYKLLDLSGGIDMNTVQGDLKTIDGQSYVVFNENMNRELLNSLHSSKVSSNKVNKDNYKILVLNGTKINGLASELKGELGVLGWNRVDTGNANPSDKTIIQTNNKELEEVIKLELPKINKSEPKAEEAKYEPYDIVIIVGSDYKKLGE